MFKAYIIADDFTGAADTGLQFFNAGKSVNVLLPGNCHMFNRCQCDVVSISTATRNRSQADAEWMLDTLTQQFSIQSNDLTEEATPLLYKKIDSTLRGWIGVEVKHLLNHLPSAVALIAPAYPKQGRYMKDGIYTVNDIPLHQTSYTSEIQGALPDSKVQPLLEQQMQEQVGFIGCEVISKGVEAVAEAIQTAKQHGCRAILFDAVADNDLVCIADAGKRLEFPVLWVGSAGLARALALDSGSCNEQTQSRPSLQGESWMGKPPEGGYASSYNATVTPFRGLHDPAHCFSGGCSHEAPSVVIVAGSQNPATLRQVAYLKERVSLCQFIAGKEGQVNHKNEEVAETYLMTMDSLDNKPKRLADVTSSQHWSALTADLGETAAGLIERCKSRRLVLTGGDTATAVCQHLGVDYLEIIGQGEESIPIMRVHGGLADGALAVTKSGGFGVEDSLYNAVQQLKGWQNA